MFKRSNKSESEDLKLENMYPGQLSYRKHAQENLANNLRPAYNALTSGALGWLVSKTHHSLGDKVNIAGRDVPILALWSAAVSGILAVVSQNHKKWQRQKASETFVENVANDVSKSTGIRDFTDVVVEGEMAPEKPSGKHQQRLAAEPSCNTCHSK